jgi:L-threonylcarbamoyladenylate synthase
LNAKPKRSRTTAKVLRIDPRAPEAEIVGRAAEAVRSGGVVCFPTRCLYGLGADARNEDALRRIFEIKQRPADMPLLVLISHSAQMAALAERIPPAAQLLMERFWPGRLTIVLPALPDLPSILTAGKGKIGIRLAAHPVTRALVEAIGAPLTGTSANVSGGGGCRQIGDLDPRIAQGVDLILDAGPLKGGVGSTVVDVTGEAPVIIREGEVSKHEIIAVLKSAA